MSNVFSSNQIPRPVDTKALLGMGGSEETLLESLKQRRESLLGALKYWQGQCAELRSKGRHKREFIFAKKQIEAITEESREVRIQISEINKYMNKTGTIGSSSLGKYIVKIIKDRLSEEELVGIKNKAIRMQEKDRVDALMEMNEYQMVGS